MTLATQLEAALSGDRESLRALVAGLTPTIQARVARILLRRSAGRSIRDELEDMVQDVLVVGPVEYFAEFGFASTIPIGTYHFTNLTGCRISPG